MKRFGPRYKVKILPHGGVDEIAVVDDYYGLPLASGCMPLHVACAAAGKLNEVYYRRRLGCSRATTSTTPLDGWDIPWHDSCEALTGSTTQGGA